MSAVEDLTNANSQDATNPDCLAFVNDNQTHDVVSQVLKDSFDESLVRDGGTSEVIQYLSEAPPPPVLIVDVSDEQNPLMAIMSLTTALPEDTRVIGIGEVNDIMLYREILDSGASDYVVKPVTEKALATALQRTQEPVVIPGAPPVERKQVRVAVIGSRGGAGASTIATNIAWTMSETLRRKTTLVDLDLEFGTVALSLDLEPTRGLREALENPGRIDSLFISSATAKMTDNLSIMATEETLTDELRFNATAIDILFETLGRTNDAIVVDIPRTSFAIRQAVMQAATDIILVTELTLAGLRDSIRLLSEVKDAAKDTSVTIIANRVGGVAQAMPVNEFQKALGKKIQLQIPDEAKIINKAANNGKPLVQQDKRSKASRALQKLSHQLGGAPPVRANKGDKAKKGKSGGLSGFFKRK